MYRQQLKNPSLKPLQGILVIAGLVAAVWLDSLLAQLVAAYAGELVSAIVFWGLGAVVALWTLRRYVLGYAYSLSANQLTITHFYGRYERPKAEIYLNNILFTGTPGDAYSKYPDARTQNATLKRNPAQPYAIVHKDNNKPVILILQPDEKIREGIRKRK